MQDEAYTPNSIAQIKVDWAMAEMDPIVRRLRLHPLNHRRLESDSEQAADVLIALLDLTQNCRPEAKRDVGKVELLARELMVFLLRRRHEVERLNATPVQTRRRTPDRVRPRRREGRPTIRRRVARRRAGDSREPDDGPPHLHRRCDGDDEGWSR